MGVVFEHRGDWKKTKRFLDKLRKEKQFRNLEFFAKKGVDALSSATPMDTGLTASSWGYEIHTSRGSYEIDWTNSNTSDGIPIAIILQYGHGTGTGGYVQGRDYINPAIRPIFDKIAEDVWKEVTKDE